MPPPAVTYSLSDTRHRFLFIAGSRPSSQRASIVASRSVNARCLLSDCNGSADFRTVPTISGGACKRTDLIVDPRPHYAEPLLTVENAGPQIDHTRSYTSVSLTLRPPSSEPQPPIDIRSQGSSLIYSSSSLDPRGFQSRLQISIGAAGAVGSVAAARIRPPMGPSRPNSLVPPAQTGPQRPPGLYYYYYYY